MYSAYFIYRDLEEEKVSMEEEKVSMDHICDMEMDHICDMEYYLSAGFQSTSVVHRQDKQLVWFILMMNYTS